MAGGGPGQGGEAGRRLGDLWESLLQEVVEVKSSREGLQPPSPQFWGVSASRDTTFLAELLAEQRQGTGFAGAACGSRG